MLNSHIKAILRSMLREKLYSGISILGMALSFGACLILAGYLYSELTFDQHNVQYERIYRVTSEINSQGNEELFAETSFMAGPLLQRDYPIVQDMVRLRPLDTRTPPAFRHQDRTFYWDGVFFADPDVFDVFTHQVLAGDPETALESPTSIAVSESFANAYFDTDRGGAEEALGRTIESDSDSLQITLVFEDLPENSHLHYDVLYSYNRLGTVAFDNPRLTDILWDLGPYTYLLLPADYDPAAFAEISEDFQERYLAAGGEQRASRMRLDLEPLDSIHLYSRATGSNAEVYRLQVTILIAIALFAIVVAIINYINMATARTMKRVKEIGVRKVLGASRRALAAQFLVEALAFSYCGLIVGAVVAELLLELGSIRELLGRDVSLFELASAGSITFVILTAGIIGLIAGCYPAFCLTTRQIQTALKGDKHGGETRPLLIRQGLVMIQLMISIGIVACSLLMYQQMQFIQDQDLGFEPDNKLVISLRGADVIERSTEIVDRLNSFPGVENAAVSRTLPGQLDQLYFFDVDTESGIRESGTFRVLGFDENYVETMGMELTSGRDFEAMDQGLVDPAVLVNEAKVREMGWSQPLGKRLRLRGNEYTVQGVVADFNFHDLSRQIEPVLMFHDIPDYSNAGATGRAMQYRYLTIALFRMEPGFIESLNQIFAELDPGHPLEYWYLNDFLDDLYGSQEKQMRLMGVFAALCVMVSCMGLFGLSSFMTERRTKEIGIRRVLGASPFEVILLLQKGLLVITAIAAVLASILAYLTFASWQEGFHVEYRASLSLSAFLVAALACTAVSFLTISAQSYRTAQANPIQALRYE